MLQWGRNLTVAEGYYQACTLGRIVGLQWGRNLTVAEGLVHAGIGKDAEGFNGAAT